MFPLGVMMEGRGEERGSLDSLFSHLPCLPGSGKWSLIFRRPVTVSLPAREAVGKQR